MTKYGILFVLSFISITIAICSGPVVPVIKLKNKTLQDIDVQVIIGFDSYVYASARINSLSTTVVKVPGIPGTVTVQYTRSGLMANNVIRVPVVAGTELVFDDVSFSIVQPQ